MNNGNLPVKRVENFPTLFDDFFKPWREWFDMGWDKVSTIPSVNVTEADKEYKISVAAPGLQKDDFKIEVDGNLITIRAEKSTISEEKEEKFTRNEYNYTSFSRTFTLPDNVMTDNIAARYENGELKLMLPKMVDQKTTKHKKVEIM